MAAATVLATLETSASGVEFFNVISQPLTFDHVGTCFFFFCESINNTYSPEISGGPMKSFEEDFCISTWPFVSSLSRVTFTVNLVQGNPWSALWHVEINFCWGPSTSGVLSKLGIVS